MTFARDTEDVRTLAASVLVFEAVVVLLMVPVAVQLGDVEPPIAVAVGVAGVIGCGLVAALLRFSWGYWLGSVLQALLVVSAVVIPAMAVLGTLFAALWVAALVIGHRGERIAQRRSSLEGGAPH